MFGEDDKKVAVFAVKPANLVIKSKLWCVKISNVKATNTHIYMYIFIYV